MTEYSLQVMSHIDPALVEEIDLTGPKKRRLSPRLRAAVIAACVCLALLGTVSAAGGPRGVFKGNEIQWMGIKGYDFRLSGLETVPREAFRPEFLEAIEKKEDGKLAYLNREGLEKDMGFRLAENSILQQMFQGQCAVSMLSSGNLLSLQELYIEEGTVISLNARIYFYIDTSDWQEPPSTLFWSADTVSAEHHEMPDGSTALILTTTTPYQGKEYTHFHSHFIWDGIWYKISVAAGAEPENAEEVRALLEDVLDAFS